MMNESSITPLLPGVVAVVVNAVFVGMCCICIYVYIYIYIYIYKHLSIGDDR